MLLPMSSTSVEAGGDVYWLDRPALIWERKPQEEDTASAGYWNEALFQEWIQEDAEKKRCVLSYRSMLTISALLMDNILDEIKKCLNGDVITSGSSPAPAVPSIPIAVAIPEGIFLPLAIAAVHALNEPIRCSSSDSTGMRSNNPPFSAVLLPIEPTEGAERLKHMLCEARPLLALTASDCDEQRLHDLLQESHKSCYYSNSIDPASGLYRSGYTKVVDLRKALCQAKARHGNLLVPGILDSHHATGLPSIRLLQQSTRPPPHTIDSSDSVLETTSKLNRISHIVYTSGTTGVPKGCISSIQSLRHYLAAKNAVHGITEDSCVVLLASALSFDPCLSDVLATFTARATLALSPRADLYSRLDCTLQTLGITHVLCTPTLWNTLAVTGVGPRDFDCLKVVALGGEPIPRQVRQTWARDDDGDDDDNTGGCRLLATFGVTEACVYQTAGEVFGQGQSTVMHLGQDVGIPFSGLGVRICREDNQDCLVNVPGEQDVGEVILFGRQLDEFSGYLNRPQLTAVKFIYDKATKEYHYRTGDRGCLVQSRLHILGRIQGEEGMVKYNGIRVELGEVEAAIVDDKATTADAVVSIVVDCLVSTTSRPDEEAPSAGVSELIAYVVLSRDCQKELGIASSSSSTSRGVPPSGALCTGPLLSLLRARCKSRARVVPAAFVCLPRVPVSPTGKRDRKGVPSLSETVPFDALSTSTESCTITTSIPLSEYGSSGPIVAAEIIDCLNLQPSSRALLTTTATFAMLGGDSLAATRVTRALYAYQYKVFNTRFLGGDYGVLDDNRFSVVQLLRAKNLGEYIDFMDKHGLCQPENGKLDVAAAVSSPGITDVDKIVTKVEQEEDTSSLTSLHDAEASHLYDALLQATMQGHTSIAIGLLAVGADPNYGNHGKRIGKTSGRTERKQNFWSSPLHLACLDGLPCLVRELLRRGAKLNTPDASGLYPLHLAASTCAAESPDAVSKEQEDLHRLECVKMLLEAGAPLTMKDGNRQTVIHAAARAGHCNLLRHVMRVWRVWMAEDPSKQGSLDWRDRWSRTPVHWAILNGHVDAVGFLLEMGCSPHPVVPKVNKSTSAALESPAEICTRLYGSTPTGDKIASLLQRAQEKYKE